MFYTIDEMKNILANHAIKDIKELTEYNGFRTEEELEQYIQEEFNFWSENDDPHAEFGFDYEFDFLDMINWIHEKQMEEYGEIQFKLPYTKERVFRVFRLMAIQENFHYILANVKLDPEDDED